MQAWAHASTIVGDICCRRGVQRFVINVREELGGVAALFGAVPATQWIARSETTRTHYAATRAQFYKSLSVRRFLRHRVNA